MHRRHAITPLTPWLGQGCGVLAFFFAFASCDRPSPPDQTAASAIPVASATPSETVSPPEPSVSVTVMPKPRCRPDMVRVTFDPADEPPVAPFCVDRFEAVLIDDVSSARISPYYSPSRRIAKYAARIWKSKRFTMGGHEARQMPLPVLPAWQQAREPVPRAVVRKNQTPNGHVTGEQARDACARAGKRLCTPREWRVACGGEQRWKYPYGPKYVHGKCNVFREAHPAAILHSNAAIGHADPRLNKVKHKGRPLLRKTGTTPTCASKWGDDAIYDMVGNIDEWIAHAKGSFAGGFYSRSTRAGCDWRSTVHPMSYADYSTGARCCADLPSVSP